MKNTILILGLLTAACAGNSAFGQQKTLAAKTTAPAKLTEEQKIGKLITYIRTLDGAHFIRNGSEHSAKEAADHLQMKRERAGKRISTAEDFVEQLASKSSMSGKPYQIRLKDGKLYNSRDLLLRELAKLE